jgi:hypothetical protein
MSAKFTTFTPEQIIQMVHEKRDTPYPTELSPEALSETLHAILGILMTGDSGKDAVDNLGKAPPNLYQ